jgi:hypothetical protein
MSDRKHSTPFREAAIRAMEHALHERLIDRCWDELVAVFEQPEVKAAEKVIMESIARAFAPGNGGKKRRRRGKKRDSR